MPVLSLPALAPPLVAREPVLFIILTLKKNIPDRVTSRLRNG